MGIVGIRVEVGTGVNVAPGGEVTVGGTGVNVDPGGGVFVGGTGVEVGGIGVAVEPGGGVAGTQFPPEHTLLSVTPHSLDRNCVQNGLHIDQLPQTFGLQITGTDAVHPLEQVEDGCGGLLLYQVLPGKQIDDVAVHCTLVLKYIVSPSGTLYGMA